MAERKKCLVLMPFDEQYKEVYTDIYKPVFLEHEIDCWRVDEISRPGSITRDIVEGILDADIILADLTSKNPNVFYELGMAHSVGNKTIMTAQSMSDVPFDIANYRVILYKQTIYGSKKLKEDLSSSILDLIVALERTNNPFQEVLSTRSHLGNRKKVPLIKYVDISELPKKIRDWLTERNITYAEDVNKIDLVEIVITPGIGKISLGKFLAQVVENDLYSDAAKLQTVVVENGIKLKPDARGNWY